MRQFSKISRKLLFLSTLLLGVFIYGCTENPFAGLGSTGSNSNTGVSADFSAEQDSIDPLIIHFKSKPSIPDKDNKYGYSWDFGDGKTSTEVNPSHSYSMAKEYTVTLTINFTTRIKDTEVKQIKVGNGQNLGTANANFGYQQPSPKTVTLTNTTSFNDMTDDGVHYVWSFGDGTSEFATSDKRAFNHTFPDYSTAYSITLEVWKGIELLSSKTSQITTGDEPAWKGNAGFIYYPTTITLGTEVTFTNTTTNHKDGLSYLWNFGDGVTLSKSSTESVKHTFATARAYSVSLTVTENGKVADMRSETISVNANANVTPDFEFAPKAASNKLFTFTNTTTFTGVSGLSYEWNFNDGTAILPKADKIAFDHDFTSFSKTYSVVLTVKKGTEVLGSKTKEVTTGAAPSWSGTVNFAYSPSSPITTGTTVTFSNNTSPHVTGLSYVWNYGDGSPTDTQPTTAQVSHKYTTAGTYKIILTASFGGKTAGTKEAFIVVNPNINVTPDFEFAPKAISNKVFTFTNTTSITGVAETGFSYVWQFGIVTEPPKNSKAPFDYEFDTFSKKYSVTLTVKKGTENFGSKTKEVTTGAAPSWSGAVNFAYSPSSPITADTTVTFTNTTSPHVTGLSYVWNYGDGSPVKTETTTASVSHKYTTPGTYNIVLKAIFGGTEKGSKTLPITVNAISGGGEGETVDPLKWVPLSTGVTNISKANVGADTLLIATGSATTKVSAGGRSGFSIEASSTETNLQEESDPDAIQDDSFNKSLRDMEDELLRSGAEQGNQSDVNFAATPSNCSFDAGELRTFKVPDNHTGTPTVSARCVAQSPRVFYYYENIAYTTAQKNAINNYVSNFDRIIDNVTSNFGNVNDVDGNGKIIILFATMTSRGLGGFFWSGDKYSTASVPGSNVADMFYVNATHATSSDMINILAHELQHMAYFDTKRNNGVITINDVWLNEGMSVFAQSYPFGVTMDYQATAQYREFLANYANLTLTVWDQTQAGNYGYSGFFMNYLVDRFGVGIIKQIYASSSTGMAAVVRAVKAMDSTFTGTFDEIFTDFVQAMYLKSKNIPAEHKLTLKSINFDSLGSFKVTPASVGTSGSSHTIKPHGFKLIYFNQPVGSITLSDTTDLKGFANPLE